MGRQIGKVAQRFESKADTSHWLPLAFVGWTASFILREIEYRLYGKNENRFE